jgi:hypothetical protein
MKTNFFLVILAIAAIPFISSCGEDEPKPSTITFEIPDDEVNESDGTLESFHPFIVTNAVGAVYEAKIVLSRPLAANAVVEFSVSGTASSGEGDFAIDGSTLIIEKGAQEAVIPITIYEDFEYEVTQEGTGFNMYEDITVTLTEVISGPIKLDETANTFTLNVLEDDFFISLLWDPQDVAGETAGDVDMDLFVWLEDQVIGASDEKTNEYEGMIIPGGFFEGPYSFSYTYYSGTSNDLDFYSVMSGFVNGDFYEFPDSYVTEATYNQQNVNAYALNTDPPDVAIVQTVVKDGVNFKNLSAINVPSSGSRSRTPLTIKPEMMQKLIRSAKRFTSVPESLRSK